VAGQDGSILSVDGWSNVEPSVDQISDAQRASRRSFFRVTGLAAVGLAGGTAVALVGPAAESHAGAPLELTEESLATVFARKPTTGSVAVGKGELFFEVDDYGAVGDGVASDQAAIAAAMVAATPSKGIVRFRRRYGFTGQLTVPAGVRFLGLPGSALVRVGTGASNGIALNQGAVADNMHVEGKGLLNFGFGFRQSDSSFVGCTYDGGGAGGGCNSGPGANNLSMSACTITGLPAAGYAVFIEMKHDGITLIGNTFTGAGRGIFLKSTTGNPITNTVISGNLVSVTGRIGIEVWATNILIADNVVRDSDIAISLAAATACIVSGNRVHTAKTAPTTYGIELAEGSSDCVVTGNVITSYPIGIIVSKGSSALPSRDHVISSNRIRGTIGACYGIDIEYGTNILVANNHLTDSGTRALFLNNAPANCLISGNTIDWTDLLGAQIGIYVGGRGHIIDGNLLDYSKLSAKAGIGIRLTSAVCTVQNNVIRDAATGLSIVSAANSIVNNNRTSGSTIAGVSISGTASASNVVLTHIAAISAGAAIVNTGSATIMGPIVVDTITA